MTTCFQLSDSNFCKRISIFLQYLTWYEENLFAIQYVVYVNAYVRLQNRLGELRRSFAGNNIHNLRYKFVWAVMNAAQWNDTPSDTLCHFTM